MSKVHRAINGYALCGSNTSNLSQRREYVTCKRCLSKKTKAEGWNFESGAFNILLLRRDANTKMAEVYVNGKQVYLGNYWDYHNGCHGIDDFKFDCISSFLEGLRRLAAREGMNVQSLVETYSYEG